MSQACNTGPRIDKSAPANINAWKRTEFEVESGSAALANSFQSALAAIAAIELHTPGTVSSHAESALAATKIAQKHYQNVFDIEPERGLSQSHREAIQRLDLTSCVRKWAETGLVPNLETLAEDIKRAAATGKPSELLVVFTKRLGIVEERLQALVQTRPTQLEDLQWQVWMATSALTEALMAGQMVAIVHREADALTTAS